MYVEDGLDKPDSMSVYATHGGASPVCGAGVAGCCRGRPSVYLRERLHSPDCSKMKRICEDQTREMTKNGIRG